MLVLLPAPCWRMLVDGYEIELVDRHGATAAPCPGALVLVYFVEHPAAGPLRVPRPLFKAIHKHIPLELAIHQHLPLYIFNHFLII